jgi:hypothetical protein
MFGMTCGQEFVMTFFYEKNSEILPGDRNENVQKFVITKT